VIPVADKDPSQNLTVYAADGADVIQNANMVWPDWLSVDTSGQVNYDTNAITLGYWNFAVRIEDPYSYVHIDFLILIKEQEKFCGCPEAPRTICTGVADCSACSNSTKSCDVNTPPSFGGATPASGALVAMLMPGENIQFTLYASDSNIYQTVSFYMGSVPTGTTFLNTVNVNETVTTEVSWTAPTGMASQIEVMCFWAMDNEGMNSAQHCVKVQVVDTKDIPWAPAIPEQVTIGSMELQIKWYINPNMTSEVTQTVTHYEVYDDFVMIGTHTNVSYLFYTHAGLGVNTAHNYTIKCCNYWGCSGFSPGLGLRTLDYPLNAPGMPYLIQASTNSLQVGWEEIYVGTGRWIFEWYLSIDNGDAIKINNESLSYTASGLSPTTSYTFRVAACEESSLCSVYSNAATFSTLALSASSCATSCPTMSATTAGALKGLWSLNEGTGSVFQAGSSLSLLEGHLLEGSWAAGRNGKAYDFGSTGQGFIEHSTQWDGFPANDSTVCFWLKRSDTTAPSSGAAQVVLSKAGDNGAYPFHVELLGLSLSYLLFDGLGNQVNCTGSLPNNYGWNHACFVRDGTTRLITAFVNGVNTTQETDTTTLDSTSNSRPIFIARTNNSDPKQLTGTILDDLTIYSAALNTEEVNAVLSGCTYGSETKECDTCPILGTNPLADNFQGGAEFELMCRDCCAKTCNELCFQHGSNPARCMGVNPLDAYYRCVGEGYEESACSTSSKTGGCYFSGKATRCPNDCAAITEGGEVGTCDTWTGQCLYSETHASTAGQTPMDIAAELGVDAGVLVYWNYAIWCPAGTTCTSIGTTVLPTGTTVIIPPTQGSTCGSGYLDEGGACVDIDECLLGVSGCEARNGECHNTDGSSYCECLSGYVTNETQTNATLGVEGSCVDIDECSLTGTEAICHGNATCTNIPGSVNCTCGSGLLGDALAAGTGCVDIDECFTGQHSCNIAAVCDNSWGGYNCTCADGFSGNGFDGTGGTGCTDIDECAVANASGVSICHEQAVCSNLEGHYNCICNSGFTGGGQASFDGAIALCYDVDECAIDNGNCTANSECVNTEGSFQCDCLPGYEGNGTCTRCVSEGTGKSLQFDGVNDHLLWVNENETLAYSNNFTLQIWFYRTGSGATAPIGDSASAVVPLITRTCNDSTVAYYLGIIGSSTDLKLVTGVGGHHLTSVGAEAIIDSRWYHAAVTYDGTTLTLYQNGAAVGTSTGSFNACTLDGTVQLASADGVGGFMGRIREARLHQYSISSSMILWGDCAIAQSNTLDAVFSYTPPTSSSNGGCPIGSYCMTWLSPAVCQGYENIACGLASDSETSVSLGALGGEWRLVNGPSATTDWSIVMQGAHASNISYWNKLSYPYVVGPCGGSPSCSIALDQILPYPAPVFRYMSGVFQSTVGTDCSDSSFATKLLLNNAACTRYNAAVGAWQENFGESYTDDEVWDCGSAMLVQDNNYLSQAAYLSCTSPGTGPGIILGSTEQNIYVQN